MGIFGQLFGSKKMEPARQPQSAPPPPTPPQPQVESDLRHELDALYARRDPRFSCRRPLHLLQRVFIFASGEAHNLSFLAAALLLEAADSTLDEIVTQVGQDWISISNSTVCAECRQTRKVPDSALQAISVVAPKLIAKFRFGQVDL